MWQKLEKLVELITALNFSQKTRYRIAVVLLWAGGGFIITRAFSDPAVTQAQAWQVAIFVGVILGYQLAGAVRRGLV